MTTPIKGVSIIDKQLPSFGTDKQLEASIGKQVRLARKAAGVTLQQLSKQSQLSASMLSKIENGQISSSLRTIQLICHALNITITTLFKQHDKDVEPTFIKSGNGLTIERGGTHKKRHYQLLGHTVGGSLKVEPCLITVTSQARRQCNITDGDAITRKKATTHQYLVKRSAFTQSRVAKNRLSISNTCAN